MVNSITERRRERLPWVHGNRSFNTMVAGVAGASVSDFVYSTEVNVIPHPNLPNWNNSTGGDFIFPVTPSAAGPITFNAMESLFNTGASSSNNTASIPLDNDNDYDNGRKNGSSVIIVDRPQPFR
jgi:hypothetical protein